MNCKKIRVRWCSFCDFAVENEWTDPFMTDTHGGGVSALRAPHSSLTFIDL